MFEDDDDCVGNYTIYKSMRIPSPYSSPSVPPKPAPVSVRKSFYVKTELLNIIPDADRLTMLRQQVRVSDGLNGEMIEWCHDNCADIWAYCEDETQLMFLSEEDRVLFLVKFMGYTEGA